MHFIASGESQYKRYGIQAAHKACWEDLEQTLFPEVWALGFPLSWIAQSKDTDKGS